VFLENGKIEVKVENDQMCFTCGYNTEGLDATYSFLSGIILGLRMAGKKINFEPKRIISKLDPYGEEDWAN
jgi:hypothetical protein